MRIGRIFHAGCPCVSPADSLREAASRMRARGLSVIPVISDGSLIGILTERDLVEACAKGVRPSVARVTDYMSDGPVCVSVDDDSSVAGMKMLAIGCRHVPVTDRGALVGVVSARDVFLASAPGVTSAGGITEGGSAMPYEDTQKAWERFESEIQGLAGELKRRYRDAGDEGEKAALKRSLEQLGQAAESAFRSLESATRDPEVRARTKETARSFGSAVAETFRDLSDEIEKALRRPAQKA